MKTKYLFDKEVQSQFPDFILKGDHGIRGKAVSYQGGVTGWFEAIKICEGCGGVFLNNMVFNNPCFNTDNYHKIPDRSYCSWECYEPFAKLKDEKRNLKKKQTCKQCGSEFKSEARRTLCDTCWDDRFSCQVIKGGFKKCGICKVWKKTDRFSNNKKTLTGLNLKCKKCSSIKFKEWRSTKDDEYRKSQLIRQSINAVVRRESESEEDKKARRVKRNKRYNEKRKIDSKFRLNKIMGGSMWYSLRGNKKGTHWERLVDYTIDDLIEHLESKFTDEMSWENAGPYWHIDHIIPISKFNFEKPEDFDFKRCWALENLQPLEAIENLKKNNKLEKPFQPSLIFG